MKTGNVHVGSPGYGPYTAAFFQATAGNGRISVAPPLVAFLLFRRQFAPSLLRAGIKQPCLTAKKGGSRWKAPPSSEKPLVQIKPSRVIATAEAKLQGNSIWGDPTLGRQNFRQARLGRLETFFAGRHAFGDHRLHLGDPDESQHGAQIGILMVHRLGRAAGPIGPAARA